MKKLFLVWFVFSIVLLAQIKISPYFSEFTGKEDSTGDVHLFYRLYSYTSHFPTYVSANDLYHFIPSAQIDTFFLPDYSFYYPLMGGSSFTLKGYNFWHNDFAKYIYCGVGESFGTVQQNSKNFPVQAKTHSPQALVGRFDFYPIILPSFDVEGIFLSPYNDSLLYANTMFSILESSNGGWNWNASVINNFTFVSFSPYDSSTNFFADNLGRIYKTTDNAVTFSLADTNITDKTLTFEFDHNINYIYRTSTRGGNYNLIVSNNKGNPFSWAVKYSSNEPIYISADKSQSGKIILATDRKLYLSTDYGSTFTQLKIFPRKLIGVHQKAGSNIVYAATKYSIYKYENGSLTTIKQLALPEEAASLLPLKVGNKWVFDNLVLYENCQWIMSSSVISREIVGEVMLNGKKYFEFDRDVFGFSRYIRIDSTNGFVWGTNDGVHESFITDLLAEPGDFIYGNDPDIAIGRCDSVTSIALGDTSFSVAHYSFVVQTNMSLGRGIGIVEQSFCEFGGYRWEIRGAVIDGVVHGDTTLVDVKDENEIPSEFSLSQNFPNPFNPATKIKFTIPTSPPTPLLEERGGSQMQSVSLKVYDILGREVATLVNEEKQPGKYEVEFPSVETGHAPSLPSGVYFYQLKVGEFIQTRKMIFLK